MHDFGLRLVFDSRDVSNQYPHHVIHRHEPLNLAVFIDHQGEMLAVFLECFEQFDHGQSFGHVKRFDAIAREVEGVAFKRCVHQGLCSK